ncbi:MAG: hypothetical protein JJ850_12280 [Kordiimonadaceae bacterium]|nr:hypothetical protein [Kordiimonadaceae bacterium]MBO6568632.1 hypothetical protein [Kordiimonadaceae bacterium]MBO6965392.1 hypothetical protein [Kordiimonadaceae bacterium]
MSSIPAVLALYFLIGVPFGLAFVIKGCNVVEPAAAGSGKGFRLMILPASIGLWPYLAVRWLKASQS